MAELAFIPKLTCDPNTFLPWSFAVEGYALRNGFAAALHGLDEDPRWHYEYKRVGVKPDLYAGLQNDNLYNGSYEAEGKADWRAWAAREAAARGALYATVDPVALYPFVHLKTANEIYVALNSNFGLPTDEARLNFERKMEAMSLPVPHSADDMRRHLYDFNMLAAQLARRGVPATDEWMIDTFFNSIPGTMAFDLRLLMRNKRDPNSRTWLRVQQHFNDAIHVNETKCIAKSPVPDLERSSEASSDVDVVPEIPSPPPGGRRAQRPLSVASANGSFVTALSKVGSMVSLKPSVHSR